jgi:MerR family transcriptional regulator, Zn(II)-responsive regulator of zntA
MVKLNKKVFKIGELAQKSGIKVEALRYYESEGLLKPAMRSDSGYRLYNEQNLQSLFFIIHAKKVGFALKEVKFLLDFQNNKNEHTCEEVKKYTGDKIIEIESKIVDLQNMHQSLSQLHHACCGGVESAKNCSILQSLESIDS